MDKIDIKSLTLEELEEFTQKLNEPKYKAKQIFEWIHKKNVITFEEMTNLSKVTRQHLNQIAKLTQLKKLKVLTSKIDGTKKYLFELGDGHVIESVLMRYKHGNSVCISSQVGCRMGCNFCASTISGFYRNLTTSEMLEQIYEISRDINERITHVVVMGTGEPLENYDCLVRFIKLIINSNGLNISQRHITVSTCGLIAKIHKLAMENLSITLAISLHASNDNIRKKIMPIAKSISIDELLDVSRYFVQHTGRRITFEYCLIDSVNDDISYAEELANRLKGILCHVNLIPINPIKERRYKQSTIKSIENFKNILTKQGIPVTIRRELGSDIQAACGQLRKSYMEH